MQGCGKFSLNPYTIATEALDGTLHILLQSINGIIRHFPCTAFFPNLRAYHTFVPCAVTPRFTATNTPAHAKVQFSQAARGAARMERAR